MKEIGTFKHFRIYKPRYFFSLFRCPGQKRRGLSRVRDLRWQSGHTVLFGIYRDENEHNFPTDYWIPFKLLAYTLHMSPNHMQQSTRVHPRGSFTQNAQTSKKTVFSHSNTFRQLSMEGVYENH